MYDLVNRVTTRTNPLLEDAFFTYDSRDNLETITDPKPQVITNVFDELSRLTSVTTPDNTITLTYDALSHVLTADDDDSSLSFTYDALDRVDTANTLPLGLQPAATLTNFFDAVGNRGQLDDSEFGTTLYEYDGGDRLTRLTTPSSDIIDLAYDLSGRLAHIANPNTVVTDLVYDIQGLLWSFRLASANRASSSAACTLTRRFASRRSDVFKDFLISRRPITSTQSAGTRARR